MYAQARPRAALGIVVSFFAATLVNSEPPPLQPPPGWELEVAPGFSPSVESVIVQGTPDYRRGGELWAEWGDEALQVLLRLLRDERWKDYRGNIEILMQFGPQSVQDRMLARLKELESVSSPSSADQAERDGVIYALRTPESSAYLRSRFETLAGMALVGPFEKSELGWITSMLPGNEEYYNLLEQTALNAPSDDRREMYLSRLFGGRPDDERLPQLRRLAAQGDKDLKTRALQWIEKAEKYQRPFLPLDSVQPAPYRSGKGIQELPAPAVESLRDNVLLWSGESWSNDPQLTDAVRRYAVECGDASIPILMRVIADNHYPESARSQALCSLGSIGSRRSAGAFSKLYKTIEIDTVGTVRHIDNMVLAALLIAGESLELSNLEEPPSAYARHAWIAPDFREGELQFLGYQISMKRFGSHWLPVESRLEIQE
ncbi:MAG: hypothetical protein IT365_14010 [Candidatus Hydrogenedentes bacterium]|nr:hypothetical protein [Candidatus Hydrogenedentota bacterium]